MKVKNQKNKVKKKILWKNFIAKSHGIIGLGVGIFILWMAISGVILANREPIREMNNHFGDEIAPERSLGFEGKAISVNKALEIGWEALGDKEKYSRIEMKWEGGAPIYRIRFKDKEKSEITIHAFTGEVLLYPSGKKEIKKVAQDLHALSFLPDNMRWVFDLLAIITILCIISGLILLFSEKIYAGKPARKIHNIVSAIVAVPFLIMAITGIYLNHEEWLEGKSKISKAKNPSEAPSSDFNYDTLAYTPKDAVDVFQSQYGRERKLRRVVLTYSKDAGTLIYQVEPNDGMRIITFIDAHTGEIIKSSHEILLVEWIDQLHEFFLFGKYSKYLVDIIAILLIVSLISGWILAPQTLRRIVLIPDHKKNKVIAEKEKRKKKKRKKKSKKEKKKQKRKMSKKNKKRKKKKKKI
ncbi:MAG: hypothetical protein GF347_00845 [Candidatus Moranbacteria bacterium]|nr:hypothetical protein [Candidatus Moranbacteria bacterium]